jgi:hypothetical protein
MGGAAKQGRVRLTKCLRRHFGARPGRREPTASRPGVVCAGLRRQRWRARPWADRLLERRVETGDQKPA